MSDDFKFSSSKPPKKSKKKTIKKGGKISGISTSTPRMKMRPPRDTKPKTPKPPKSSVKLSPTTKARNRSEAAKKAWETRRARGWTPKPLTDAQRAARSEAAKKSWETRRANGWTPKKSTRKSLTPDEQKQRRSEAAKKAWETRKANGWKPKPLTEEQRRERSERMKEYWKRKRAEGWRPESEQNQPEPETPIQPEKPDTEPLDRTTDIDDYEPDEVESELDDIEESDEALDGDASMYDSIIKKIDAVVETGLRDELADTLKQLLNENIEQYGADFFDYLNDNPDILEDLDIVFYESSDDKDAEVDKITEAAVRIATVLSGGEFNQDAIERIRSALYSDYQHVFYVESWSSPYDD